MMIRWSAYTNKRNGIIESASELTISAGKPKIWSAPPSRRIGYYENIDGALALSSLHQLQARTKVTTSQSAISNVSNAKVPDSAAQSKNLTAREP
jgi:hypothetical protein